MASAKQYVSVLAFFGAAVAGLAQSVAPGADPALTPPVQSTPPTEVLKDPPPKKPRVASGELSSVLSAGIKYQPPKPKEEEKEPVDLREIDKPRNGIVRLPNYIVEGQKPAVFSNRNIYTARGLADYARNRYLSNLDKNFLNRWSLPLVG